jgi:mannosyltransferase
VAANVWPVTESRTSTRRAPVPVADEAAPIEIVVIALGALALGVLLRFVTRSPLWLDEALSVNIARLPLADIPAALRHDGHPPLYYVLLHGWMSLFGRGDGAVRSMSGVFSLVTLPLVWLAGRRRGGPLLGWIALGVLALAPFGLRYATETRMYSLVMVLVLAGYLLVDDVARRRRPGWLPLAGLALVSGALLLTHYWSIWLLGAVELVLAWRWWRSRGDDDRRPLARAFLAIAAGGVFFLPWLPSFLYQSAHTGTPWASAQRPTSVVAVALADFGGGAFRDAELVGGLILLLSLLALFGSAVDGRQILLELRTRPQFRFEAAVVALTLAIGVGVAIVVGGAFASRYASVFFPLVILLTAGGITRFTDRRVRAGVLSVFLALGLLGAYWNVTHLRSQGRMAAHAIDAAAAPGDVVVFCPDQLGPAFSRSLRTDLDRVVYPTLAPPERVDWVDYGARNAAADPAAVAAEVTARAAGRQIFVVWQPAYRTLEGQCEALIGALSAARPGSTTLVVADAGGPYFEPGSVTLFPAAS